MAAEKFGMKIIAQETSYETLPEADILDDLAGDPQMLGLIMAPASNRMSRRKPGND